MFVGPTHANNWSLASIGPSVNKVPMRSGPFAFSGWCFLVHGATELRVFTVVTYRAALIGGGDVVSCGRDQHLGTG